MADETAPRRILIVDSNHAVNTLDALARIEAERTAPLAMPEMVIRLDRPTRDIPDIYLPVLRERGPAKDWKQREYRKPKNRKAKR